MLKPSILGVTPNIFKNWVSGVLFFYELIAIQYALIYSPSSRPSKKISVGLNTRHKKEDDNDI